MSKRILFILICLATTLIQIQFAMADYRITNGSATESAWVVYSTFRPADRNWPAGWWTTGWLKILPGTTRNLPIPANNNSVYLLIVAQDGKEIRPTDQATRTSFRFPIHPSNVAFRVVVDKNGNILKSSHDRWTLKDATLYRYRNGGSHTILSNDINSNGINIELPSDIISEVAFAPNSTYFIVKAKYPNLTGVSGMDILYGSCIFTLRIPDGMQGFVFPIKTAHDASVDLLVSVGLNIVPLGGTLLDTINLFKRVNNERNRELKIELHTSARHRQPPKTVTEFIVLLKKHPAIKRPDGINITIEQQYVDRAKGRRINKVSKSKRWIFDDGWAAPPAQVTVFDYPPFQLLPAEIRQYLLLQFSEFGITESGLIPKETALLANYPNPFNPETWIPYQLATPSDASMTIYDVRGRRVRHLHLGHQPAGFYQNRSRAAYWDGRNAFGEPVASGVYFYTFTAGEFTATRKMLIRK